MSMFEHVSLISFISHARALGIFLLDAMGKRWHVGSQQCMFYVRDTLLEIVITEPGMGKDSIHIRWGISDIHTVTCGLSQLSPNSAKAILGMTLNSN